MWYVEDNRGYITASKIKLFMKSKEAYKKVYVDEVDTSFLKESKSLENGTIVDSYILTPEQFRLDYAILEGTKKDDLIRQCLEQNIPVEKSDKVEDLKAKLVGNKQVLTDWEVEMVKGIEAELKRQPLFDFLGKTENQKEIIVEYKGFKLKAKMDRLDLENKKIRDLKTSKDIEYRPMIDMSQMEYSLTISDEYQYGFQLSFYAVLCYIQYGEWFDGILDCVKTSGNYAYEAYFYHKDTLKRIASSILFPALDELIACHQSWDFGEAEERKTRGELLNERYYPILDSAIQKDFRIIEPAFIC